MDYNNNFFDNEPRQEEPVNQEPMQQEPVNQEPTDQEPVQSPQPARPVSPYVQPPQYTPPVYPPKPPKKSGGFVLAVVLILVAVLLGGGALIAMNTDFNFKIPSLLTDPSPTPTATATTTNPPIDLGTPSGTIIDPNNPVISIAENIGPCVVTVYNKVNSQPASDSSVQGTGSGVIISKDGYIVTNNHVIEAARKISVVLLNSDEEIEATLIGSDSRTDLALLKVNKTDLPAIEFGKKENIRVGELAVAIGNPLGETGTVTTGIVSAIDRTVDNEGVTVKMLQTDAAINPGNSGGALVNIKGQLIGICTMKTLSTIGENGQVINTEGMGYAIPIDTVEEIVSHLIQDGKVVRAGLGITGGTIEEGQLTLDNPTGIYVSSVSRNQAADQAGIEKGDIIYQLNGEQITDFNHMVTLLAKYNPGDKVTLTVYRYRTGILTFEVTLTELSE